MLYRIRLYALFTTIATLFAVKTVKFYTQIQCIKYSDTNLVSSEYIIIRYINIVISRMLIRQVRVITLQFMNLLQTRIMYYTIRICTYLLIVNLNTCPKCCPCSCADFSITGLIRRIKYYRNIIKQVIKLPRPVPIYIIYTVRFTTMYSLAPIIRIYHLTCFFVSIMTTGRIMYIIILQ